MNSIHKRALKFTYDGKGNKLSDTAPPNMKAYCQSLKSCFALSMFFWDLQICKMQAISLHANDHTVLEKVTQTIWILLDNEILQFFG